MPNTKLYDRSNPEQHAVDQGLTTVAFTNKVATHGWNVGAGGSDVLSSLLTQHPSVSEIGRPILLNSVSADLSVEIEISVPTGKYWRLIGGVLQYTASADAATRTPILTIEQSDDTALDTITMATKVANDVENESWLHGTDGNVGGNADVAAQATLTLDTNPTAGDTMTIDSVTYTFYANGATNTAANGIELGATLAATKTNIEAVLVDGLHPTVNAIAFATNDMVLTARTPGTAGNSLVSTETFTAGTNVFDGATFGTTTAGVDAADDYAALDYPTNGVLLVPTDKVVLNVTNGHANDAAELFVFAIEFDNDPR